MKDSLNQNVINDSKKIHILRVALRLFEQFGYQCVSVAEICRDASISKTTFYGFFKNKDDVLMSLLYGEPFHLTIEEMAGLLHCENHWERIWRVYELTLHNTFRYSPELLSEMYKVGLISSEVFPAETPTLVELITPLIEQCQKEKIIRNLAPADELFSIGRSLSLGLSVQWCNKKGAFDFYGSYLHKIEILYDVDPSYRLDSSDISRKPAVSIFSEHEPVSSN